MKVKVIGLGGIGTALLPGLARFLRHKYSDSELWLIDGDRYEPENADRQHFEQIGNKAEEQARLLEAQFPELMIVPHPEFLNAANARRLIENGDVVFVGVDNHKTRKIISDYAASLNDVLVISGGNELTHGSVQVYWRRHGEDRTLPLANQYHPEIMHPEDHLPGEHCDRMAPREPQIIFMNEAVASAMKNAFYAALERRLDYDTVYIDILTNAMRPVNRRKEAERTA